MPLEGRREVEEWDKSSATTYYNIFKETLSVRRGRRMNGNEIRENT
jgi:hypothetical protein